MKRKIIALLLCIVCVVSLCFPVAADDDGYSAIVSDIDKTCPTCGATLHASWGSTSGAEVELEISDTGKVKIPAGAGAFARIHLRCSSCGYEKTETRLLGLDFGAEKPGKLVQAPSGIGRKDLPGYVDDSGTPYIGSSGVLYIAMEHDFIGFKGFNDNSYYCNHRIYTPSSSATLSPTYICRDDYMAMRVSSSSEKIYPDLEVGYKLVAPIDGYYSVFSRPQYSSVCNSTSGSDFKNSGEVYLSLSNKLYSKGTNIKLSKKYSTHAASGSYYYSSTLFYASVSGYAILQVKPLVPDYKQQANITINNNTWNGNIYVDNSTNLTYIYPQYTTINEKNETVTNISNTPIIYNNETKQYYTYDQTTKKYYYITFNAQPTPSPSPTPTPTDKPGGSISTPETGKPGGSSGSGQSWWDKLLDKIGNAVIDGLLGAVSAVLKLIFKLLSTILSWIIWAVSRVFDLLPFLPPGLGGLLVGGVVVCFVIGIIKFIRG